MRSGSYTQIWICDLSIAKNQKLANDLLNLNGDVVFPGNKITRICFRMSPKSTDGIQVDDEGINLKVATPVRNAMQQMYLLDNVFRTSRKSVQGWWSSSWSDPHGQSFHRRKTPAFRRRQMAGRHGNKGVASTSSRLKTCPSWKMGPRSILY